MRGLKNNISKFNDDSHIESQQSKDLLLQTRIDLLSFALDQCEDIIMVIDENTRIIFINSKARELLGYHENEVLTMHIEDVAPNFREEILMQFPNIDFQSLGSSIINMYYKTKDQRSFLVEVKISPFVSSKCYFSLVAKDISVNTQLYDLPIHNEKEFVAFVETSNDIIIRFDMDLRCIYVNETFEKITGYSRLRIVEKSFWETGILSEYQIQLMKTRLSMVIESEGSTKFECVLNHAITNLPVHLEVHVQTENDLEDKVTGFIIVAHDI